MGLPRQECWSGLPFSSPGRLPDYGTEPVSPALAGAFFTTGPPGEPLHAVSLHYSHPSLQLVESPPPNSTPQLQSYLLPEALKLIIDRLGHSRSSNLCVSIVWSILDPNGLFLLQVLELPFPHWTFWHDIYHRLLLVCSLSRKIISYRYLHTNWR